MTLEKSNLITSIHTIVWMFALAVLLYVSIIHPFLLLSGAPLCAYHSLFIRAPVDGQLGYFQLLTLTNKAAVQFA